MFVKFVTALRIAQKALVLIARIATAVLVVLTQVSVEPSESKAQA